MGSSSSSQTTGYRYYAGLHLVFCHAIDALLKIRVGEKWVYERDVTENTTITIDKPNVFGGESSEGGIKGDVDVCFGADDQEPNAYLQEVLETDDIPAYRGLFGLVANQCMVSCNNPYPKEWSILAKRTNVGWLPDLAEITASDGFIDLNPAHIIYETLTDTTWGGLGYPVADLDIDSFEAVAYKLAQGDDPDQEAFGLSLIWAKDTTVEDFLDVILSHIGGVLYFSHVTGLLTLKLIRGDYTKSLLPVIDQSVIVELEEYKCSAETEMINQVIVKWVDRYGNQKSTTVQNAAAVASANGEIISRTIEMFGVTTSFLATRIATREIQQVSVPLSSITAKINRKYWSLEPGDCFVLNLPFIGVNNVVMRVGEIEIGELTDGVIRIQAVRDVYGLGPISIIEPQESLWEDLSGTPMAPDNRALQELTWWEFIQTYGESQAVLAELDSDSTRLIGYCESPQAKAIKFQLWNRASGADEFIERDASGFAVKMTLGASITPAITSTLQLANSRMDTDFVKVGTYALIDDELVAITAVDHTAMTVTVTRGVLDTVPVAHTAGSAVWFYAGLYALDETDRVAGEEVEAIMLTVTSEDVLEEEDAEIDTITLTGRMMRPYPPGGLKINGEWWPDTVEPDDGIIVTWAHRDRITQTVNFVRQDAGDYGPEAGTTYTVRCYLDGALDSEQEGITGKAATVYPSSSGTYRIDVCSVRDGLESWQAATHTMSVSPLSILATEEGNQRLTEEGNNIRMTED